MSKLILESEPESGERLSRQAISFFLHSLIAVAAWTGMMLAGYALHPDSVPQPVILALSIVFPLIVGNLVARFHPDENAPHVWLAGIIWLLIMSLWIIDLPTGPNACLDCGPTDKLARTLFSYPHPSGLLDNNGPFFGTWPAAALLGYAFGAFLVVRHKNR